MLKEGSGSFATRSAWVLRVFMCCYVCVGGLQHVMVWCVRACGFMCFECARKGPSGARRKKLCRQAAASATAQHTTGQHNTHRHAGKRAARVGRRRKVERRRVRDRVGLDEQVVARHVGREDVQQLEAEARAVDLVMIPSSKERGVGGRVDVVAVAVAVVVLKRW